MLTRPMTMLITGRSRTATPLKKKDPAQTSDRVIRSAHSCGRISLLMAL